MGKFIFILSMLIIFWGYLSPLVGSSLSEDYSGSSKDTTIKGEESTDTPSFGEYISRLHQLIMYEIEHDRSLLYRLIVEKESVFRDTAAINYLSRAFQPAFKDKSQEGSKSLWDTAAIDKLQLLLKQKIYILLWNDSVWQAMKPYTDSSFILINIPANTLLYVHEGGMEFSLRTVTGKTSAPTPVLNSRINAVIQYPYWNIPRKIAVNEMLPFIRNYTMLLRILHLEVLEGNKVISNPEALPWKSFSSKNFPYCLRQTPGPWNALGLLKFEFPNPYHVYLHDTNDKTAFRREIRYLSHGCIRLENPVRLALRLGADIDTITLTGKNSQLRPATFTLAPPVRIFVIYATLELDKDRLKWLPDIYNKVKAEGAGQKQQLKVFPIEN